MPASITDFIANNYGNNYCVADYDESAGLGLDNIDEIDTNSMAIYSGESVKKDLRGSKRSQQPSKQEPADANSLKVDDAKRQPQLSSNSLLIPSGNDANETSNVIDADLMLNVLDEQQMMNDAIASTSGLMENNDVEAQNTLFDETSPVTLFTKLCVYQKLIRNHFSAFERSSG